MEKNRDRTKPHHLVLVPCHAVYRGCTASDIWSEAAWVRTRENQDRYGFKDEVALYVEHVNGGLEYAASHPDSILIFSGGQTQIAAGPISESQGYWRLAEQAEWMGHPETIARTFTEGYATDSFENLLFGIYRFFQVVGICPSKVTVVGLGLKAGRFEFHATTVSEHRADLGIPAFEFDYVSVNDVPGYVLNSGAREGEAETFQLFKTAPMGDTGPLLSKRRARDPFLIGDAYSEVRKSISRSGWRSSWED